jgi:hypothetical protein
MLDPLILEWCAGLRVACAPASRASAIQLFEWGSEGSGAAVRTGRPLGGCLAAWAPWQWHPSLAFSLPSFLLGTPPPG